VKIMKMITEADLNNELALQALLEKDLMAFTEFAFGVVRPGVPLKRNWHLDAVSDKLYQLAKGYIRRLITAPAFAQIPLRIGGSAGMVSRPLSLGALGRCLLF